MTCDFETTINQAFKHRIMTAAFNNMNYEFRFLIFLEIKHVGKSEDGEKLNKKKLCTKVALEKTKFLAVELDDFRFRIRHELRTPREFVFFKNPKLLGLGRQIGLKFWGSFWLFPAKLLTLFWHCESLVHGKV